MKARSTAACPPAPGDGLARRGLGPDDGPQRGRFARPGRGSAVAGVQDCRQSQTG